MYKIIKILSLTLFSLCLACSVSAELKIRYPLGVWNEKTQPFHLPSSSAINAFYDHNPVRSVSSVGIANLLANTKNFKCQETVMYDSHTGIDYAVNQGNIVYAAASGKVKFMEGSCDPTGGYVGNGCGGGYGNQVILEHENGTYRTDYGHLSSTVSYVIEIGFLVGRNIQYLCSVFG